MKRVVYNIVVSALLLIFLAITIIGNTWVTTVPVATVKGSYANSYAKQHHLKELEIADSIEDYIDVRYEEFDYNLASNGVIIERYKGIGNRVVVPQSLSGYSVVEIGDHFFESLDAGCEVYLPLSINTVSGRANSSVKLYIDSHSSLVENLTESEWNLCILSDSEYAQINFTLESIPFFYNINGNEIELTAYTGTDKVIIIPSYINGYPVRCVSFDMLEYDGVIFPDTVTSIEGKLFKYSISSLFVIELLFCLIAVIASVVEINVIIPGKNNKDIHIISLAQGAISIVYVFLQLSVAILFLTRFVALSVFWALLINVLALMGYIVSIALISGSKKHAQVIARNQKDITSTVNDIKSIAKTLDISRISNNDLKEKIRSLLDDIRYLYPLNNEKTTEIDISIMDLLKEISNQDFTDETALAEKIDKLKSLLLQRKA